MKKNCKHKWNLHIYDNNVTVWKCLKCERAKTRAYSNGIRITSYFKFSWLKPYRTMLKDVLTYKQKIG